MSDFAEQLRDEIDSVLDYIDIIDCVEFLEELYDKIYHLDEIMRRQRGLSLYFPIPVNWTAERVMDRINELTPEWYKEKIATSKTEIVNGYALFDSRYRGEIGYRAYTELCQLWDSGDDLTYAEFVLQYDEVTCRDWGTMDEHGECFGGFWDSDDPQIKRNAFDLTIKKNMELLWQLPFPTRFLLKTIEIGCPRRQESVRDSNYLGVWFERKRDLEKKAYTV